MEKGKILDSPIFDSRIHSKNVTVPQKILLNGNYLK